MNAEGDGAGAADSLFENLPSLRQKIINLLPAAARYMAAAASVLLFAALCLGLIYGAVTLSAGFIGYGLREVPKTAQPRYDAVNEAFDSAGPSVNVTVTLGGDKKVINTSPVTVEELLASIGIYPDGNDEVNYPPETAVADGMEVVVNKIDEMEITLREVIKYDTEVKYVQTIPAGTRQITQYGENGLITRTLRQTYINGKLESETVLSEVNSKQAVVEKVKAGTGGVYTASDGTRYPFSYYIDVVATAYGGELFDGLTYTGKQVELGMIAVDPAYIPLGSMVYVIGDYRDFGVCYAEDIGEKVVGASIDIYMGNDMEAMKVFGRRPMRVYILK